VISVEYMRDDVEKGDHPTRGLYGRSACPSY